MQAKSSENKKELKSYIESKLKGINTPDTKDVDISKDQEIDFRKEVGVCVRDSDKSSDYSLYSFHGLIPLDKCTEKCIADPQCAAINHRATDNWCGTWKEDASH